MKKKTRTSTKSKSNKEAAARSNKKAAARPALLDQLLRDHLLYLLKGGGAHANVDAALGDWPCATRRGQSCELPSHPMDAARAHAPRPVGHRGVQPRFEARFPEMARRILACLGSSCGRESMDREYGCVQEGLADDGTACLGPESRSLRPDSLGRWADDFARGAARGRPQCISPRTTGDAAEEHRNLSPRSKLEHRRDAENAENS